MSAEDVINKLRSFDVHMSGAEIQELLDFIDARHAELMAVHQDLGEKVQELIDGSAREARLRDAVIDATDRLKTLNAEVFFSGNFTDRYGDGKENGLVITRCLEALK